MLGHCAQSVGGALPGIPPSIALPSYVGAEQSSSATVSLPEHQAGDLLILIAGRRETTALPELPEGWTLLASAVADNSGTNDDRTMIVAWRVGDGVRGSVSAIGAYQSAVIAFRNAKSGRFAVTQQLGISNTLPVPSVQIDPARSRTMLCFYAPALASFQTHVVVANRMALISNGLLDSQPAGNATLTTNSSLIAVMMEVAAND